MPGGYHFHSAWLTYKVMARHVGDMPITAYQLGDLDGEFVDGPSHLETDVDVELGRLGERLVLTQTTRHPAAPDRAIRSELRPEEARELQRELDRLIEE